jgi:hypothetical protein
LNGIDTKSPMAPEISLENQRPAEFVFDGLVKTLTQKREDNATKSGRAQERTKDAGHAA